MDQVSRKETAVRLGISERTLSRRYKGTLKFDIEWVNQQEYLYRLNRALNNAIKAEKQVKVELKHILRNG